MLVVKCDNGPQTQTIVAPSKTYKVSAAGRFSGRTTESIGGVASETVWIKGRFLGPQGSRGRSARRRSAAASGARRRSAASPLELKR
jgi:hypothetical protein